MALQWWAMILCAASLSTDNCSEMITWVSNPLTYVYSEAFRPAVIVSPDSSWVAPLDSQWLWESSYPTIGTYSFFKVFPLTDRIQSRVAKVVIKISCYHVATVRVNNIAVLAGFSSYANNPKEVDITNYVKYSTPAKPTSNKLEIACTATSTPGGLAYRIEVQMNPTARRMEDEESNCEVEHEQR